LFEISCPAKVCNPDRAKSLFNLYSFVTCSWTSVFYIGGGGGGGTFAGGGGGGIPAGGGGGGIAPAGAGGGGGTSPEGVVDGAI